MKTLIEIHALQNFVPSNLNRDDTGSPKNALFGGVRRARISSQCSKRAIRLFASSELASYRLSTQEMASRTKRLCEALVESLVEMGRDEEAAADKAGMVMTALKLPVKGDGKTEYLLFLGQQEVSGIAELINDQWDNIVMPEEPAKSDSSPPKKKGKAKKEAAQRFDPQLRKALDAILDGGKAVDVALFGRMLADMPEKNQNAACQVAHAISTHAVEREFDFYTAVDDRKPEDTAGADMMGMIDFNSACYYRYAVVDWETLVSNLQGDNELAKKGLLAFLEGFVKAEPTGKQNSFAAHNPCEFVGISVRRNTAPRNLANAFESGIYVRSGESLTSKSVEALVKKAVDLQQAFGSDGETVVLDLTGANTKEFGESVGALDDLLDRTVSLVTG